MRYEIVGPRMNPVSAMSYKIWDDSKQDYINIPGRTSDWEFLRKEDAEKKIKQLMDDDSNRADN